MSVNSVSNLGTMFFNNNIIKSLNTQINNLTQQVSTGKVAGIYADLGTKAGTSLDLHAQDSALTTYVSAINNVQLKTDQMDTSMTDMTNALQTITAAMDKLSQGGTPDPNTLAMIQSTAQNALSSFQADINTTVGGQYVFGGNNTNQAPITDTTAANTNVGTIVSAYTSGTPASTIIANLNSMTETQLGYNSNLAAAGNNTFQADSNLNLNYTVKGDESQFQDTLKGLTEIANLNYDPNNSSSFWTLYKDAQSRLTSANTAITARQGQLGIVRSQMASIASSDGTKQLTVEGNISNLEDTDLAAASSQFSALQTQQQATFQLLAQMKNDTLVNYLGTA